MLTGLATYLQLSGCDVRWYTSEISEEQLNDLSIQHYPFDRAKNFDAVSGSEVFQEKEPINESIDVSDFDLVDHFKETRPDFYADTKDIYQAFPFDLIITDCGFSDAPFPNTRMNIPVLTVASMRL